MLPYMLRNTAVQRFIPFLAISLVCAGLVVIPGVRHADACTLGDSPSVAAQVADPSVSVLRGEFISKTPDPNPDRQAVTYTFRVDENLKNQPGSPAVGSTINVSGGFATCVSIYPLNQPIDVLASYLDLPGEALWDADTVENDAALRTLLTGTFPAPPGSGPIASFARVDRDLWAVFDSQQRTRGYIVGVGVARPEACPGGNYLYGTQDDSLERDAVVVVDLRTLQVRRFTIPDDYPPVPVQCLDAEGTLIVESFSDGQATGTSVQLISGANVRNIPPPRGATEYLGPLDGKTLVWATPTAAVVTDLNGKVLRTAQLKPLAENGYRDLIGTVVVTESNPPSSMETLDLATGVTATVQGVWTPANNKFYQLLNVTTLNYFDPATGATTQLPIIGGPTDAGWKLSSDPSFGLTSDSTNAFYTIDASGHAMYHSAAEVDASYAAAVSQANAAFAPFVDSQYRSELLERLENGPTPMPGACGTSAIPTLGYKCELPILPELT